MAKIEVRQVWSSNSDREFRQIEDLLAEYPFVAIDTEFPGIPKPETYNPSQTSEYRYQLMKKNVEATNIIQLGLTLFDPHRKLPGFVWEFNFKDFDIDRDQSCNKDSIELLKRQGIDFSVNKQKGLPSSQFASWMLSVLPGKKDNLTWVTFQSAYDFGYLVKMLSPSGRLPVDLGSFLKVVKHYFGHRVYDIKHMIKVCGGIHGGLDKVAKQLGVERVVGKSHQAGSDSLVTLQTYIKLRDHVCFSSGRLEECCGVIHGLEIQMDQPIPPANMDQYYMSTDPYYYMSAYQYWYHTYLSNLLGTFSPNIYSLPFIQPVVEQ